MRSPRQWETPALRGFGAFYEVSSRRRLMHGVSDTKQSSTSASTPLRKTSCPATRHTNGLLCLHGWQQSFVEFFGFIGRLCGKVKLQTSILQFCVA